MYKHLCIKPGCANTYEDEDPDRYYCPTCNEARLIIAKQVDAQFGAMPKERAMSDLEVFDAQAKTLSKPDGSTASFVKTTL